MLHPLPTTPARSIARMLGRASLVVCIATAGPAVAADTKPADGAKAVTDGAEQVPPPLLDENGKSIPEIARTTGYFEDQVVLSLGRLISSGSARISPSTRFSLCLTSLTTERWLR